MQALSFAVHIPLVCFGIAFPALVLLVEWLLPAHRRPALPHARQALVEGDGRAVRRRRRHRHDPLLRDGPAVAGLHGHVRRRVRPRLRARGLLVLRRGDLHRDLRLRLGPHVAARALLVRHPDRRRRPHRLADGDLRQRVDEQPDRLPAASGRPGRRRRAVSRRCSATRYLWPRARAHVPRRLTSSPASSSRPPTRGAGSRGRRGPLRADRARRSR